MQIFSIILLLLLCISGCSSFSGSCEPTWMDSTERVVGIGFGPENYAPEQRRPMAERASKISAISTLMYRVYELPYHAGKVKEYLPTGWTPTNFVVEEIRHSDDGSCHTTISLALTNVWEILKKQKQ